MTMALPRSQDEFDGFYQEHFGQVVAMTYVYTADLHEAQDIAQEAFSRAWERRHKVFGYDNPGAWVRRVAMNLARSRWRRLRVAASFLAGYSTHESVPELNPDHVAVVAALRNLPQRQREVIVWHHIADQPVDEVARQLGIPVGTVKTWLQRGRHSLAAELGTNVQDHVVTPASDRVIERAERLRRNKTSLLVAGIVLLIAIVTGAIQLLRPAPRAPVQPGPAPSRSPKVQALSEVDPNDPIHAVDWRHAVISLAQMPGCPSGRVTFTGSTGEDPWFESGREDIRLMLDRLALGDVTGDGRAEAVVLAYCGLGEFGTGRRFILLRLERDGTLTQLGWADPPDHRVWAIWLHAGTLYMDGSSFPGEPIGTAYAWRWTGSTFVGSDSSAEYPAIGEIDLSPLADQLYCQGLPPADPASLRLTFGPDLLTTVGDRRYDLNGSYSHPKFVERGRFGNPYLLLTVQCIPVGRADDRTAQRVLFDRIDGRWQAIGLYNE
jgi:RNA polymerase sigma-70 factor (sigma-E family)